MIDVQDLVRQAASLAPLPQSAVRLATLLAQEDWSVEEIEELVGHDPALASCMLSYANSALYSAGEEVHTVGAAVSRLGSSTVVQIALSASAGKSFQVVAPELGLEPGALWRHSLTAALAVEKIAEHAGVPVPPESYAAALLHDLGKLLLCAALDEETCRYLKRRHERRACTWLEAEEEVLHLNHAHLGGLLARNLGLPRSIEEAIHFHHDPTQAPDARGRLVCMVVHVADALDELLPESLEAPLWELALTMDDAEHVVLGMQQDLEQVLETYGQSTGLAA